jgi:hypothetical protein
LTDRPHLVVATPCFGGQVSSLYATSLLKLQQDALVRNDLDLKVLMLGGDALITRARANLVAYFLGDPTATHLLFIDADIAFEPAQVRRLLEFGRDMTAAVYPVKKIDWEKARAVLAAGRPKPEAAALSYVMEFAEVGPIGVRDGFAKVRYAGTGFLMIRRQALESMCRHYPALQFRREHIKPDPLADSPHRFALFDCLIDPESGHYLSEDYSFCRRWTDMGGEIWADLQSRLTHTGPVSFPGDVATQFTPNAAEGPAS